MKKYSILIIIIIIALLGVTGGVLVMNKNKTANPQQAADKTKTQQNNTNIATADNAMASLQQALTGGGSIQCSFTDETGKKVTSYVKQGKIRADIESKNVQESGSVVMKDHTMYFWSNNNGIKMALPEEDMQTLMKDAMKSSAAGQQQQVMRDLEKYKESCSQTAVADTLFTIPSTVEFKDMSSMMKSTNGSVQPSMSKQQIEEMMKQYQKDNK